MVCGFRIRGCNPKVATVWVRPLDNELNAIQWFGRYCSDIRIMRPVKVPEKRWVGEPGVFLHVAIRTRGFWHMTSIQKCVFPSLAGHEYETHPVRSGRSPPHFCRWLSHLVVSWTRGTPKSSILVGFPVNIIHFGIPPFWRPISKISNDLSSHIHSRSAMTPRHQRRMPRMRRTDW